MSWNIYHGDCREVMQTLHPESVDSIVSDPPYGLSFMGKGWDHGVPGVEFWVEALRVAKPGAHLLAFGGTRTYHRLACAIEDAGWEIRDCVMWVYGSGFPKSKNVSLSIDKGEGLPNRGKAIPTASRFQHASDIHLHSNPVEAYQAKTDAARQWSGWGTALKPAWEPIIVARKPLCGTVAENVLTHGTGGINVDGCRVRIDPVDLDQMQGRSGKRTAPHLIKGMPATSWEPTASGRWPANVIHDGSDEVVGLFPQTTSGGGNGNRSELPNTCMSGKNYARTTTDGQPPSSGSAARFFYCAKASKADRDEGCEGLEAIHRANGNKWTDQDYRVANGERPPSAESGPRRNHHPTVKPTDLMRYLCRLVTPPGGIVLDPFMGSGSTGKAAILEGFRFVGIEREAEYLEIARARIQPKANPSCVCDSHTLFDTAHLTQTLP